MKTASVTVCLFILIMPCQALAYTDSVCSTSELLECFHINQQQCITAREKSIELCSSHYDLDNRYPADGVDIIIETANCSVKQFFLISSITPEKLNNCKELFTDVVTKDYNKLKQALKSSSQ